MKQDKLPFGEGNVKEENEPREPWAQEGVTVFSKPPEGEQDLLLTKEEINKFLWLEEIDPIENELMEICQAQLAKAEQYYKGNIVPPEMLEKTIMVRVNQAVKEEREKIIAILVEYSRDDVPYPIKTFNLPVKVWQALKEGEL